MCNLQHEIATFLRQMNLPGADTLSNQQLLSRLSLLTDINAHLNYLIGKLQSKNILVTDVYSHITIILCWGIRFLLKYLLKVIYHLLLLHIMIMNKKEYGGNFFHIPSLGKWTKSKMTAMEVKKYLIHFLFLEPGKMKT